MSIFSHRFFQYGLLVIIALLFIYSLWALLRGRVGRRAGVMWTALWLAAGIAVLWPNATSYVARALGIGRGADLVFYCAVVAMLIGFWATYIRLCRVRRDITLLVRHLAIRDAEQQLGHPRPGDDSPGPATSRPPAPHESLESR